MKRILAPRASAILYKVLCGRQPGLPFLLPANICPIVPLTFMKSGVPFEFVDISPRSLGMDPDLAEKRLRAANGRIGGILYAHPYGHPSAPDDFFRWAKERWANLLIIDDRCLCTPDLHPPGAPVADVILYSTGYAKIVDIGFGGFAFLGQELGAEHPLLPYNEPEMRAFEAEYTACVKSGRRYVYRDCAWLQTEASLPSWKDFAHRVGNERRRSVAHRQKINAVYDALIPAEVRLEADFQLWRFNLRLQNSDVVTERLFAAGLFASSHYRSLVGIMGEGTDVHARDLAARVVNLFNDHHYTADMAERTAGIIVESL